MIQRCSFAPASLFGLLVAACAGCTQPHFPELADADVSSAGNDSGLDAGPANVDGAMEPVAADDSATPPLDASPGGQDEGGPAPDAEPDATGPDDGSTPGGGEPDGGPLVRCEAIPLVGRGLGHAAVVGDFDGDRRTDLALGEPARADHAGGVCVHYGKSFVSNLFAGSCQELSQNSADIPGGNEGFGTTGDRFGFALAVGDFDGNGMSDLAVGVPGESITESATGAIDQETGLVDLIFGTRGVGLNALNGSGYTLITPQDWTQDYDGFRAGSNDDFDFTGAAVAALDVNGDGTSDLFVGAPGETPQPDQVPSAAGAGAVFEVSGPLVNTAVSKSTVFTATDFSDVLSWPVTGAQGARAANEYLGATLLAVATDLPGNTARSVVLAGSPGESAGVGAVYAWFIDPALGFSKPTKKAVISTSTSRGASFGKAIASDGRRVFIGAPGEAEGAGRVYVVDLTQIPSAPDLWPPFDVLAQPNGVADGPEAGDAFGHALALEHRADFDLLLVGVPGERLGNACNAGVVHRFRAADLSYYDSVEGQGDSFFGFAVGAGDFDGDGVEEAFATAPNAVTGQLKVWN